MKIEMQIPKNAIILYLKYNLRAYLKLSRLICSNILKDQSKITHCVMYHVYKKGNRTLKGLYSALFCQKRKIQGFDFS